MSPQINWSLVSSMKLCLYYLNQAEVAALPPSGSVGYHTKTIKVVCKNNDDSIEGLERRQR